MKTGRNNLTEGPIWKGILLFALPILLGNIFQQFYHAFDSWVVGKFIGENALAAVTSTGSLIFLIVGFFGGVYGGVGVVIARCFGAGDEYQVKRAVGTAVAGTLMLKVLVQVLPPAVEVVSKLRVAVMVMFDTPS